jgi:Zn-dependent protease with chaperone function
MDPFDGVRALLPPWAIGAGGLLAVATAFATGLGATALGARVARLRSGEVAGAHWTERARRVWPARAVASLAPWIAAGAFSPLVWSAGPLALLPAWGTGAAAVLAAWLGGATAAARVESLVSGRGRGPLEQAGSTLGVLVLLLPQLVWVGPMNALVTGGDGAPTLPRVAACVVVFALLSIFGTLPLARAAGVLRPPSERVRAAVARAAVRTGTQPQAVFELALPMVNAFAFPVLGWLVFTGRCARELAETELEAIACHELGHLAEPARVRAARVAGAFVLLPFGFASAAMGALGPLPGVALVAVAALALAVPISRLARRMEDRADAIAHGHEDGSGTYARALERLHELNLAPATGFRARGTHMHLHERMRAAGVEPAWPRPAAPSGWRLWAGLGAAIAVVFAGALVSLAPGALLGRAIEKPDRRVALAVAFQGGTSRDFFQLATFHSGHGRAQEAAAALHAALALAPFDHAAHAHLAQVLAQAKRCQDAHAAWAQALAHAGADHLETCDWIQRAAAALVACPGEGRVAPAADGRAPRP